MKQPQHPKSLRGYPLTPSTATTLLLLGGSAFLGATSFLLLLFPPAPLLPIDGMEVVMYGEVGDNSEDNSEDNSGELPSENSGELSTDADPTNEPGTPTDNFENAEHTDPTADELTGCELDSSLHDVQGGLSSDCVGLPQSDDDEGEPTDDPTADDPTTNTDPTTDEQSTSPEGVEQQNPERREEARPLPNGEAVNDDDPTTNNDELTDEQPTSPEGENSPTFFHPLDVPIRAPDGSRQDCETQTITIENIAIAACNIGAQAKLNDAIAGSRPEIAYGYLFQRGNNYPFPGGSDGDDHRNTFPHSSTQVDTSNYDGYNPYSSGTFIVGHANRGNPITERLRGGGDDYQHQPEWDDRDQSGYQRDIRKGPCPDNFHVPSAGEWATLLTTRGEANGAEFNQDTHSSDLPYSQGVFDIDQFLAATQLPPAGFRKYDDASLISEGTYGHYWSSSYDVNAQARNLYFETSRNNISAYGNLFGDGSEGYDDNAYAFSVRCFADAAPIEATIAYSTTATTFGNVEATISFNQSDITITNTPNNAATYTFTGNGSFTFEWTDENGNEGSTTAKVDWIEEHVACGTEPIMIGNYAVAACNVGASYRGETGAYVTWANAVTACSGGYHLPTRAEWTGLYEFGISHQLWTGGNGFLEQLFIPLAGKNGSATGWYANVALLWTNDYFNDGGHYNMQIDNGVC